MTLRSIGKAWCRRLRRKKGFRKWPTIQFLILVRRVSGRGRWPTASGTHSISRCSNARPTTNAIPSWSIHCSAYRASWKSSDEVTRKSAVCLNLFSPPYQKQWSGIDNNIVLIIKSPLLKYYKQQQKSVLLYKNYYTIINNIVYATILPTNPSTYSASRRGPDQPTGAFLLIRNDGKITRKKYFSVYPLSIARLSSNLWSNKLLTV